LYIHRQSSYLIGREQKVADIPVLHPLCSKQHAALQYRLVPFRRDDGTLGNSVRPYIIDLKSTNGIFVNNVKIEARMYVVLMEKDVIKFGFSSVSMYCCMKTAEMNSKTLMFKWGKVQ
jgi:smad nuclear-interacting protein 1